MSKSCSGCKYLLREDAGYSNYTVEETTVDCLLRKNPNLPATEPWDWNRRYADFGNQEDNWSLTAQSRCDSFAEGEHPLIDVERELKEWGKPWEEECVKYSDDPEVQEALRNYYA